MPVPIDNDALTQMCAAAGMKVHSMLSDHDPASGRLSPSSLADAIKDCMGETCSSQAALAASSQILSNAHKKGVDNCSADDHAMTIQNHLTQLHQAGMSAGVKKMPTKLTKEERAALDVADFADPEHRLYPILGEGDLAEAVSLFSRVKNGHTLRKNAEQIARRKGIPLPEAWGGATMSVEFSISATEKMPDPDCPGHVLIPAPILFRCGDYPDKDFSLTPEEADSRACANFKRVELDLEHKPTVLSGKLGHLAHIELSADDPYLITGKVSIPNWLDGLLGPDDRKLSVAFCRSSKQVIGCGIVRNPRVSDAAMMAAFAYADTETTPTLLADPAPFAATQPAATSPTPPAVLSPEAEKLRAEFAAREAKMVAQLTAEREKTAQMAAQNEAQATERRKEQEARVAAEAVNFADSEILAYRAMPAQRDQLIEAYRTAARDDMANPNLVSFGTEQVTRIEQLKRIQRSREPYHVGVEGVPQNDLANLTALFNAQTAPPPAGGNAIPTEDRRKQLLAMTQLGRQALGRQSR